jgi:predicted esterase
MEQFLISPVRRYFELELPSFSHRRGESRRRWPLLIALHGYQGDKDSMMRVARRIAAGQMLVISLQGPNHFFVNYEDDPKNYRVGFGWGTTWKMEESIELHHHNVRALVDLSVRKYRASRGQVFLLAFSQACSYNYRFVFTHPRLVRGAIAVCGGVPSDWNENPQYRPAQTHVLHIAATRDRWYSREKNLEFRRKLAQRAASLDFRFYNSPHKFPRTSVPHIRKWIEKHL